MKLYFWVGLLIALIVAYYLVNWVFWLAVLAVVLWGCYTLYRFMQRLMTPHGKRIRHSALRGHLQQEYGTREGGKLYREMVSELRKQGYR